MTADRTGLRADPLGRGTACSANTTNLKQTSKGDRDDEGSPIENICHPPLTPSNCRPVMPTASR